MSIFIISIKTDPKRSKLDEIITAFKSKRAESVIKI